MATADRRTLRFNTIDEALAEANRLVAAQEAGKLKQHGNWPLGQMLGHLATWATFALDGYPREVHPPMLIRLIAKLMKNRIINKSMMPGLKVGRIPGGTVGLEPMSVEDGLSRFKTALDRLRQTAPTQPNPILGELTHEEWIQLNLRHAELHFSFLNPS